MFIQEYGLHFNATLTNDKIVEAQIKTWDDIPYLIMEDVESFEISYMGKLILGWEITNGPNKSYDWRLHHNLRDAVFRTKAMGYQQSAWSVKYSLKRVSPNLFDITVKQLVVKEDDYDFS